MKTFLYPAIAALALTVGIGLYRHFLLPHQPAQEPAIAFSAFHLAAGDPAAQAARLPPGVPEELPGFTLADSQGIARSLGHWPEKAMIVNFWATWCAPCRREIPLLNQLQQQYAQAGFQVVGVALDLREAVLRYAQDMAIQYPLLIGEPAELDVTELFSRGAAGLPFTIFTDRRHRIIMFHLGELQLRQAQVLLAAVAQVDQGRLTPAQARAMAARQLAASAIDAPEAAAAAELAEADQAPPPADR